MGQIEKYRSDYLAAGLYSRDQVFSRPGPVPEAPGVYGWWFRTVPADIDISGCAQRDELTLLYAGISPKRTTSQREAAEQSESSPSGLPITTAGTRKGRLYARRSESSWRTKLGSNCVVSAPAGGAPSAEPAKLCSPIGWPSTRLCPGWFTRRRGY